MRIGIIGAGRIGSTLARLFAEQGHEVAVSNAHGPESLQDLVATLGTRVHALRIDDAAGFGEVVVMAIPWRAHEGYPGAETVAGKILVDAMNPYRPDGSVYDLGASTSSEEVGRRLPGARVVKAFNTVYFQRLATEAHQDLPVPDRLAVCLAGDDQEAKAVVARLIEQIGFAPVDTGSLHDGGRLQQPGSLLFNNPLTGQEAAHLLSRPDRGKAA